MKLSQRAVFLDRDGILNRVVKRGALISSPRTLAELVLDEEAVALTSGLAEAGFSLVVVTNQPDLSRGLLHVDELEAIHAAIASVHQITRFYVCPHRRQDQCVCRKPADGLLRRAAGEMDLDLGPRSWAVGDRWADVAAGRNAGVRTALRLMPWSWDAVGGIDSPSGLAPDLADHDLEAIGTAIADDVMEARSAPDP